MKFYKIMNSYFINIVVSFFTHSMVYYIMLTTQHPKTVNEISNEVLALQSNFVYGLGAAKTRSVSGREK